jgi:hypothetical protein
MIIAGWNNGLHNKTGSGYGIRISREDREKYFQRVWDSVIVEFEGVKQVYIRLSDSFWRKCTELRTRVTHIEIKIIINQRVAEFQNCHSREGGNPVKIIENQRLLDSHFHGNDEKCVTRVKKYTNREMDA